MPYKSAFKRSILNVQPAREVRKRTVPQSLQERAVVDSDFTEAKDHGFASVIGRQFPVKSDSSDAIPLTAGGIGDSGLASSVSSDPERPELIALTSPFVENADGIEEVLRLRDFESSIDESDLTFFYKSILEGTVAKDVEKRSQEADKSRTQLDTDLGNLMGIAESIDRLRDNCSFVNGIRSIHEGSNKYLQSLPQRFGSKPASISIDPGKTFAGIDDLSQSSSTALVTLLVYSLLYPGSARLSVPEVGDSSLTSFIVPTVSSDPVNDLLTSIVGIDVNDPAGYLQAESLLPQDPISRIALISEALSYELGMSVGISRIKSASVLDYITNVIGQTPSIISDPSKSGTVLSSFRDGTNLPLEINDVTVAGTNYKGLLSAYVDGPISDGTLNFKGLDSSTKNLIESLNRLITDIKKLRLLDDTAESLTPMGIVTLLSRYIAAGTSSLGNDQTAERSKHQLAQLLLLRELASATTSGDLLESRFRTFQSITTAGNEIAQTENSDPNTENAQVSTTSTRTRSGSSQGEKTSLRVTVDGKSTDIQVENTSLSSPKATTANTRRVSSISSSTTGSTKQSYKTSSTGKTNYTTSQAKSKSGSTTAQQTTASTTEYQQDDQAIYDTFTGKGGSGHITSTFGSTFDIGMQEPSVVEPLRNDLFTQFGLSFGVASILGFKDLVKQHLLGENVNVEDAITTAANRAIDVPPSTAGQGDSSDTKAKQQDVSDTSTTVLSSAKQYTAPHKKSETSVIGLTSVLSRKAQQDTQFGMPNTPVAKKSSVTQVASRRDSGSVTAEGLFGTSAIGTDIPTGQGKQSLDSGINLSQKAKSRTTEESQSILDIISSLGITSGSSESSVNTVGKQSTPQSDLTQLNAEVRSFLTLFPVTSNSSSNASFGFSMTSIKDTLRLSNSGTDSLLSGEYRKFVQVLLETAGELAGDTTAFTTSTTNYGIGKSIIDFLCYSMFTSMCTLLSGIQGSATASASKGDFDITITADNQRMFGLWQSINGLAVHTGSVIDFVQESIKTSELTKLVGALRYADKVTEVLKLRYSVLQNFINTYSSAVATFMSSMTSDSVQKTASNIRKTSSTGVLRDISQEAVSGAQQTAMYSRGPLSLDISSRQVRIAKRLASLLYATFDTQDSLDSFIATVGIPSKTIEVLRRHQRQTAGKMTGNLQEYIEVTFSRQDIQFPDVVLRNVSVRFCPRLDVVPTFTVGASLSDCIKEFTYLCHDGTSWKRSTVSEAISFVSSVTGLDETAAYVVVTNHAIDAISRSASYAIGIPVSHEIANVLSKPIISTVGANIALRIMKENRAMGSMMGNLLPGDFLRQVTGGFEFKRFTELEPGAQKLTNESRHRLLGVALADPIFTYESTYNIGNTFSPFERSYNCIIDPDEFVIDKKRTLSTVSGKTAFDRIVSDGLVDVYDDVAVFRDTASTSLINGAVYATKVDLVIS